MRTPLQALTGGPTAIPPMPAAPALNPPTTGVTARQNIVAANGNVGAASVIVNVGLERARTRVTIISTGQNVDIFDDKGTHIRSITLIPGRRYYGSGKPRGPRPRTKRPD